MAQTIIARLNTDLNPAFNTMKYIIDSTNKNEEGFRYVFDLYESGTTNKIAEYKVIPKPVTGYGEQDISRVIQSLVSTHFLPTLTSHADAVGAYYDYDLKVGEEFVVPINYTASLVQNGLYVKITATHTFVVGDQVTITQDDGGVANPNLEGLFTVTAVTGTTDFTVSSLWSDVTDATIDGTVLYADNRKTITRDITNFPNVTAFNGALTFLGFINYSQLTYDLNNGTDKLLTTLPTANIRITPEQSIWLNAWSGEITTRKMFFENSDGDTFEMPLTTSTEIQQICVASPDIDASLTVLSGTAGLVKPTTTSYEFYVVNSVGTRISQIYSLDIDRRCNINDYEVYFMDRMGSIASFTFGLKSKITGDLTKTNYNQAVTGKIVSTRWVYDTFERGETSVNHSIREVVELNTDHLNQTEIDYFTELINSPYTWIKVDGVFVACVINTTQYEIEQRKNKNLNRKTIQISYSNQNIING